MHKLPELSIIMPFRNAEKWLCETVDSIQKQGFTDWELIAIDDFSDDGSAKLIQNLAESDKRIVYYPNTNKGIIPALTYGLSRARGTYISRMDADDLMPPGRLSAMLSAIRSHPARSVITGKVQYFSEKPVSAGYRSYEQWLNERIDSGDHYAHIYRECVVASPNWLARKKELLEDQVFEALVYPEDYSMVLLWKSKGYQVIGLPDLTLLWREHPARTSRNSAIYQQKSFFELKIPHFLKHELKDNENLAVLGAGIKGKLIARALLKSGHTFNWYDQDFRRYGAGIYQKEIQSPTILEGAKLLIAIYPTKQDKLIAFLEQKGFQIGVNAWFC